MSVQIKRRGDHIPVVQGILNAVGVDPSSVGVENYCLIQLIAPQTIDKLVEEALQHPNTLEAVLMDKGVDGLLVLADMYLTAYKAQPYTKTDYSKAWDIAVAEYNKLSDLDWCVQLKG
ncbi:hypothetical protein BZJ19_16560 [Salinivibrio proteolyticus]|uniref:hypothetical protein n=1 Tax=Salinivibrio proteolyticus TaxID=334715 RepID=UPI000988EF64|nr:hypothetical protein [Salinivibrio proteolyticus]OOF21253.1 hypothetical protein BZJ19_16560 [Salinivibrio proteolyticus]